MPNRANTMSNDDHNAVIKSILGSGTRPSSHMPATWGNLSLRCPSMFSGLIRYFPSTVDLYFERHEHSRNTDSSVIAPRNRRPSLCTQGFGKPEFQEIEEIQLSCRK